ncbi:MAG: 3-methyladenine DNA glycosylase AlkC [Saprospiraceae bacterium]|jgi:3-methyladenine DNA glycosylase AlkC
MDFYLFTYLLKNKKMADFQLKDKYNTSFFEEFTTHFQSIYPEFPKAKFFESLFDEEWEMRELKQRMRHITICLGKVLPKDYRMALEIMKRVGADLGEKFEYMFFPDFVEVYGLDDYEASVEALQLFTMLCSSEFAVRPFIVKYTKTMMDLMLEWAKSENHHIRRLASEGCRPRLPWGMSLQEFKKNPAAILPILEILKDDESEYVRRSVANNLNDVSKDHSDLVLNIGESWFGVNINRNKLVKHALRTLLKKGNTRAMLLFGFDNPNEVYFTHLEISLLKIKIGNSATFSFKLKHTKGETIKLRIEYAVYYMKSNGTQSRKIFQLTENTFETDKIYAFKRKQHFKNLTTRKHYVGSHRLALVVNGVEKVEIKFELI